MTDDNRQYKTLSNGAIMDMSTGRITDSHNVKTSITVDNSHAMLERRREVRRQAIEQAIIDGTSSIDLRSGLSVLGKALVSIVLSSKDDKAKVQAFKAILQVLENRQSDTSDNTIRLSDDSMRHLLDTIDSHNNRDR